MAAIAANGCTAKPIPAIANVALVHAPVDESEAGAIAAVEVLRAVALGIDQRCEQPGIDVEL